MKNEPLRENDDDDGGEGRSTELRYHHREAVSAMLAVFEPPARSFSRCDSSVVKDTHTLWSLGGFKGRTRPASCAEKLIRYCELSLITLVNQTRPSCQPRTESILRLRSRFNGLLNQSGTLIGPISHLSWCSGKSGQWAISQTNANPLTNQLPCSRDETGKLLQSKLIWQKSTLSGQW